MSASVALVTTALAVALAGCAGTGGATSDCAAQVRLHDRMYTGYGSTERSATRFAVADQAECHDVGEDAEGSVFPNDPRQVTVWSFDGYPPAEVLGVRFGQDSFTVFVAESVPRHDIDRILDELSRRPPRR